MAGIEFHASELQAAALHPTLPTCKPSRLQARAASQGRRSRVGDATAAPAEVHSLEGGPEPAAVA